jgi:hypothetical protein
MCWGVDFSWSREFRGRRRMGIIDILAIQHLGPITTDYVVDRETVERVRRDEQCAGRVTDRRAVCIWRPW